MQNKYLNIIDFSMLSLSNFEVNIWTNVPREVLLISTSIPKSFEKINVRNIEINREEYKIIKDGVEIVLPRKEFELFYLLATKPGKVFTREEILDKVWGNEVVVGGRTIDVHIRKLREKIGDDFFKTIKGVGYKIEF
jgi:two-component system alkaline phosphatase synthesis response regulator PhoP